MRKKMAKRLSLCRENERADKLIIHLSILRGYATDCDYYTRSITPSPDNNYNWTPFDVLNPLQTVIVTKKNLL